MRKSLSLTAIVMLMCLGAAAHAEQKDIRALDALNFDGAVLQYTYTVQSGCPAKEHKTTVSVEPVTSSAGSKTVRQFDVTFTDTADDEACGVAGPVTKTGQSNLRFIMQDRISELEDEGYTVAVNYSLTLPPVRVADTAVGAAITPTRRSTTPEKPKTVRVMRRSYSPLFTCTLYKNDGSRRDGFSGQGETMDDAIQQAVTGCRSTNNPSCQQYGQDPSHTQCKFDVTAHEKVEEYDADKVPDMTGAATSYTCAVNTNDSSIGTLYGTGGTESEARRITLQRCQDSGMRSCDTLANDDSRFNCDSGYTIEGPKPFMHWTCTLYKNDGSRRDGFSGSGDTIDEARQNATNGCRSTNNPSCDAYSKDPAHTSCSMKMDYTQ